MRLVCECVYVCAISVANFFTKTRDGLLYDRYI